MANSLELIHECSNKSFAVQKLQRDIFDLVLYVMCLYIYIWCRCVLVLISSVCVFFFFTGTRVWEQSKVQRGKVHHRAGSHDQGQRVGVTPPAAPCLFLTLEWSLLNCVERRPPCPSCTIPHIPPPRNPFMNLLHPASFTCTHPPAHRETEQNILTMRKCSRNVSQITGVQSFLLKIVCSPSQLRSFWVWPQPFHSQPPTLPSAPPPNHAYKWLWWYGDHYAKETDFAEDISLFSLIRPSSETNDFDDFR